MSFRVITTEPDGAEAISSSLLSVEVALGFAQDLIADGVEVARIKDRAGDTVKTGNEVAAWCAARPRKRVGQE